MSSRNSCRKCGSFNLESDPSRGDIVCTDCGVVLEDSVIVSEVQFEENAHGGSSAIGQFVSSDSKRGNHNVIGSFSHGLQKESREITIQKSKAELSRMCQQLRINQHCLDSALTIYKMALINHLTKGRRNSLVCAACLYIACRLDKTAHLLIDFSDVLQVDPFTLGRTFTSIAQDLCITLPLVDPCIYILRYANQMELGDKTHEVYNTALRVLTRMKRDSLQCGRRPSGLCGSALIIAARFHNIRKRPKDIADIVHIQEMTLRKRLLEFGETPTSSLTTDEFLTVDLGEEQDPPSFKAARLKDKERLQKYTDIEYELKMKKLQRLIEKELEKKKTRGKRTFSMSSYETEIDADENSSTCSSSMLKNILTDNLDDENEVKEVVVQSALETIDDVCNNVNEVSDTSKEKGIGPSLESIGINKKIENNCNSLKNDSGNTNSTVNDDVSLENSLDELNDEELDSYIVSDEEFRQKQKIWLDMYSSFLQEQKKRELERSLKNKEDKKPDRKKKRQRKIKTESAVSAGEAVEKVLREKKLSNKLNYDVLKSLNMDDFVKNINFCNSIKDEDTTSQCSKISKDNDVASDKIISNVNDQDNVMDQDNYEEDDDDDLNDDLEDPDESEMNNISSLSNYLINQSSGEEEYD